MTDKPNYAEVKAMLAASRTTLAAALPALTSLVTELLATVEQLVAENEELQNRVWSAERNVHAHDPWDGEDA